MGYEKIRTFIAMLADCGCLMGDMISALPSRAVIFVVIIVSECIVLGSPNRELISSGMNSGLGT